MDKFLYLLPYLISLALSIGILGYSLRRHTVRGTGSYLGYITGQTLWILGFILETIAPDINGKMFWDGFEWLAGILALMSIPVFAVNYTGIKLPKPRLLFALSFIVPVLFTLILITDPLHHLIYQEPYLQTGPPFPELIYGFTWVVYGYSIYSLLISFISLAMLIERYRKPHNLYRSQIAIIAVGFFIPLASVGLATAGIKITPTRDPMPLTAAISSLILAWGLFRFHLFDIVPVARDIVFENISDYVLVLDNQNRVIDANPSFLSLVELKSKQVIGHPAANILHRWPEIIEALKNTDITKGKQEFILDDEGAKEYVEVEVSPIVDRRKQLLGRVFVGRDITERKKLEQVLRNISHELEERVRDRTKDLAEAYDTTLEGWARALELRDKETEGHSRNVTELTIHLAQLLGVPQEDLVHIRRGALLHDIGKMAIPDEILRKPSSLNPTELEIVRTHPEIAHRLLAPISFLRQAIQIPYFHHEKWDGSGYPMGLSGETIPLAARIFAVVDVWDALRSERPYRAAQSEEEVIEYITAQAGKHFDPDVVDAFLRLYNQGWI